MTKRRIFVAGLNDGNCKCPPEDSGLYMFDFKNNKDSSIQEVHLYEPNNIVIADVDWLRKNWGLVENWVKEEKGSHLRDMTFFEENLNG